MKKKTIWDLNRDTVEQYKAKEKNPLAVVLDNVRSLNNIGSIFRTSDAFGIAKICLCGITATPPSPEIHKTALGAEDSVEWQYFDSTDNALASLRAEGYIICALEQAVDSVALQDFKVEQGKKYAIVAGHEVNGVDQAIVDSSDFCIEIPQVGTKHSLNVSVSTGVAMWHFFEQMINGK
ncbi:MAG: RNA methyltransferase [Muribaculaceae bacterium]|nr:RNA methyltransferase [Muribaculaceae bacterium]